MRRADLDVLLADPASARALVRHLAARIPGSAAPAPVRTGAVLALVPFDARTSPALVRRLAERLAAELGRHARLTLLDGDATGAEAGPARLDAAEAAHELVLLVAEHADDAWARFCLRQADRPLVLADASRPGRPSAARPLPPATQLVLVGDAAPDPWLRAVASAVDGPARRRAHHLVGPTCRWRHRATRPQARRSGGRARALRRRRARARAHRRRRRAAAGRDRDRPGRRHQHGRGRRRARRGRRRPAGHGRGRPARAGDPDGRSGTSRGRGTRWSAGCGWPRACGGCSAPPGSRTSGRRCSP